MFLPQFKSLSHSLGLPLLAGAMIGCASTPVTSADRSTSAERLPPCQVVRGCPNPTLDSIGWCVGIPNKLALWNSRADNHQVSVETERKVLEFLGQDEEDLSMLIRINQYDPSGEWRRLAANQRVGTGWRYTFGTLHLMKYTLLPGRIFGGDSYNPYTDTLNLYSDIPALGITEAAYAHDVHQRTWPGPYAAVQDVPFVGMWHKTLATQAALQYYESLDPSEEQREGYDLLVANYGASWGSEAASFIPYGHFVGRLGGAAVGHVTNGVRALAGTSEKPSTDQESVASESRATADGISQ